MNRPSSWDRSLARVVAFESQGRMPVEVRVDTTPFPAAEKVELPKATAPRIPRRERMCAYVRELGQATALVLRKMNPTPTEWWQILGVHVMAFVCTALHTLRPVVTIAIACWLYVWLPTLTREAHRWCMRPRMSWRKLIALNERQAKKPRRKRLDEECLVLLAAAGVLGSLALAIYIPAMGA